MPGYVCCPECKGMMNVERIGPVGKRGIPDSDQFLCNDCGTVIFRSEGETWKEAHGSIRSWP